MSIGPILGENNFPMPFPSPMWGGSVFDLVIIFQSNFRMPILCRGRERGREGSVCVHITVVLAVRLEQVGRKTVSLIVEEKNL